MDCGADHVFKCDDSVVTAMVHHVVGFVLDHWEELRRDDTTTAALQLPDGGDEGEAERRQEFVLAMLGDTVFVYWTIRCYKLDACVYYAQDNIPGCLTCVRFQVSVRVCVCAACAWFVGLLASLPVCRPDWVFIWVLRISRMG